MNFSEFNKTVRACALISLDIALWTIITNGSIDTFLHPRSLPFIKISFFILCGLTLFSLRNVVSPGSERTLNWKAAILFLPIILYAYVKPTGLSSRIAVQKGLASVAIISQPNADKAFNQTDPPEDVSILTADSINKAQVIDTFTVKEGDNDDTVCQTTLYNVYDTLQDESLYVKLDRIYSNPQRSEGKKVTITGFVAPDTLLGRQSFFIARMMVSCCAADAMPVGFYCITDSVLGIEEGDWVILSGQIESKAIKLPWDTKKQVVPVLRVSRANKTAPPRRQYIYPVAY